MKKKLLFTLIVLVFVGFLSSCRGFKMAPPCPAYSSAEIPANQSQPR